MRFSIVTYSTEGVKDQFPLDVNRSELVDRADLIVRYLDGEHFTEIPWLHRALVVVPGLGIWPLEELKRYDPTNESRRFTSFAVQLVRVTMRRVADEVDFGHAFIRELTETIDGFDDYERRRRPFESRGHGRGRRRSFDPAVQDLAEAALALTEAVRVILKHVDVNMPRDLDGNLNECQRRLEELVR